MQRDTTGHYEITSTAGEAVRAFVPEPLPPHPPLDLGRLGLALKDRALLACGRLDGVSSLLPDPDLFLYAYVRREALLSSQIEGTQSSLSDLLLFELEEAPGIPFDDVVEVSSYVAALDHGLARLASGFPLSSRLLKEIHAVLLARGRGADRQPGEFRRSQNWIGGTRPGNARFVPPPPGQVEGCMAELERFLHAEDDLPLLVKAALAHVQFETIHPFLDGNGRLGRLLIVLMLVDGGILRQPLLYLSLFFKQHRSRYYELLDAVRRDGDWEAWVTFVLEGVDSTAAAAVNAAQRLLELFRADEAKLTGLGRSGTSVRQVYAALRQRPLIGIPQLAARAQLSFPTAAKALESLVALGIAREITGGRRNRVFAYDAYLAILGEGADPL
ncbi:Fic family protein [Cyanobium sp. Cruz CV13-4-11]|uniref:Fic family protein n=1 Tax=unclassified Cyanobium TaxID=2627006 RepID=UPI0020D13466|nr:MULTISPECIES: Fic family protein [unclassified Cyanobium]MCP9900753.1 Fic family protein [Cyanobium sp. Cruz CV11-17]MCP9919742.1 Fic family protein [Cyanobium sp. Cruz CV13-4-11]